MGYVAQDAGSTYAVGVTGDGRRCVAEPPRRQDYICVCAEESAAPCT